MCNKCSINETGPLKCHRQECLNTRYKRAIQVFLNAHFFCLDQLFQQKGEVEYKHMHIIQTLHNINTNYHISRFTHICTHYMQILQMHILQTYTFYTSIRHTNTQFTWNARWWHFKYYSNAHAAVISLVTKSITVAFGSSFIASTG